MGVALDELIVRADSAVAGLGHAPSTLWQYRWAWARFRVFCCESGTGEFTDEVAASFLAFVACEFEQGRLKEWKRKLLRKAVLVLSEVAATGTYTWSLTRARHPNDGLDTAFRPVQERYEQWLTVQGLARATQNLYATVSRTVMGWLPEHGVTGVEHLSPADMSATVVFLGGSYQPGSMRTVLSALRVWCRFLDEQALRAGLAPAIPAVSARRVRSVVVLPAGSVRLLVDSANPGTATGRRNRAMLLLAARTGLRPGDIAGLRLGDIDWRHAQITVVQHKTATVLRLPLLAEVGAAIADYLLHGRPTDTGDDHVFLRAQAPHVGLTSSDLYHVAAAAFARTPSAAAAGGGRGMRVLRASLATRMLEQDTPLPVIAAALGHSGIDSAKHYLGADEARMRQCCLSFEGIEPAGAWR